MFTEPRLGGGALLSNTSPRAGLPNIHLRKVAAAISKPGLLPWVPPNYQCSVIFHDHMCSLMTKSVCLTKKWFVVVLWRLIAVFKTRFMVKMPIPFNYPFMKDFYHRTSPVETISHTELETAEWKKLELIGFQPINFRDFIGGGWRCRDNINVIKSVINMVIWLVLSKFHWYINV